MGQFEHSLKTELPEKQVNKPALGGGVEVWAEAVIMLFPIKIT